jgi:hypothetical protein
MIESGSLPADELADCLAGRRVQRYVPARSTENLEGQAGLAAVRAGSDPPPIGFDRIEHADARSVRDDLLDQELRR